MCTLDYLSAGRIWLMNTEFCLFYTNLNKLLSCILPYCLHFRFYGNVITAFF